MDERIINLSSTNCFSFLEQILLPCSSRKFKARISIILVFVYLVGAKYLNVQDNCDSMMVWQIKPLPFTFASSYGKQLVSWLLSFSSSSILVAWEKQCKMAQVFQPSAKQGDLEEATGSQLLLGSALATVAMWGFSQ